jgi:hypothetical protein
MWEHAIVSWLSLPTLFHITQRRSVHPCSCKWQNFILLWLNNIPLYIYTTLSLSVHPLVNTSIDLISWLLWLELQWTWSTGVFNVLMSFLLDIHPVVR